MAGYGPLEKLCGNSNGNGWSLISDPVFASREESSPASQPRREAGRMGVCHGVPTRPLASGWLRGGGDIKRFWRLEGQIQIQIRVHA